jgi:hypothetical protein
MSFIYLKTKVFTRNAMKDRVDLKLKNIYASLLKPLLFL